jgi:four helix bundle protein
MSTAKADLRRIRMMPPSAGPVVSCSMQDPGNLVVSEYAHRLAVATYRHTHAFPSAERFGITSQMRRGAVSISSTIAEGCGRRSNRELVHYLHMAIGSANELAAQLRIATDLGFGNPASAEHLATECKRVQKMLTRLITYLRNRPDRRDKGGRP